LRQKPPEPFSVRVGTAWAVSFLTVRVGTAWAGFNGGYLSEL
jgi:hypothetical protein